MYAGVLIALSPAASALRQKISLEAKKNTGAAFADSASASFGSSR
jgi:hypothetical protein